MKASVVDLRYKMNDVLKALDRKEEVTILHRGKVKGKILPVTTNTEKRVQAHPFFGMAKASSKTVLGELAALRNARVRDL
jgi:antitoxin (DNA-binding transcriptional repressor) of toxin-antitoxin stability system